MNPYDEEPGTIRCSSELCSIPHDGTQGSVSFGVSEGLIKDTSCVCVAKTKYVLHHEEHGSNLSHDPEEIVQQPTPRIVRVTPTDCTKPLARWAADDRVYLPTRGRPNGFAIERRHIFKHQFRVGKVVCVRRYQDRVVVDCGSDRKNRPDGLRVTAHRLRKRDRPPS